MNKKEINEALQRAIIYRMQLISKLRFPAEKENSEDEINMLLDSLQRIIQFENELKKLKKQK